jgi:hypothetical protein
MKTYPYLAVAIWAIAAVLVLLYAPRTDSKRIDCSLHGRDERAVQTDALGEVAVKDTVDMARKAGFRVGPSRDGPDDVWGVVANLKRFEAFIRVDEREARSMRWDELIAKAVEAEREACAKVCEQWDASHPQRIAAAIRVRGTK